VHEGPGAIEAILVSQDNTTAERVTLYDGRDSGGLLLSIIAVHPNRSPTMLRFNPALRFQLGLYISTGASTFIHVFATGREP
jgi:hypothetical protein